MVSTSMYGYCGYRIDGDDGIRSIGFGSTSTAILFGCNCVAILLNLEALKNYFSSNISFTERATVEYSTEDRLLFFHSINQNENQMEHMS